MRELFDIFKFKKKYVIYKILHDLLINPIN